MLRPNRKALEHLNDALEGTLHYDELTKVLYATDASVYRMLPLAVAYPKTKEDIKLLITFAKTHHTTLIPRTAGTSLAGQCVGEGIIVDVSRHFTKIISVDEKKQTVTVQPGVVRDGLNVFLKPYGLFFGPNTSTSNRCMIGGMVGNNSSGTTSIRYGVTRDKVLALETLLSDGSEVTFNEVTVDEFHEKCQLHTFEGEIYKSIYEALQPDSVQHRIKTAFPKPEIHRRNTGYAVDELLHTNIFSEGKEKFNMCKLLSGSEGTLAFTTQITLQLDVLPPSKKVLVAAHFDSIEKCLKAVVPAMSHYLFSCEMMDKTILDCTKHNKTQLENRQFIVGDPDAILMCELCDEDTIALNEQLEALLHTLKQTGLPYALPILKDNAIHKAHTLRKAGLGLLGNIIGDKKAVACIEDTAVALPDLANYIQEFSELMASYRQDAVYYAHAGAGELHLRPILNLKKQNDVKLFRTITFEVAKLVKKYRGSFSGEHGDGIVRGEFIPYLIGEDNYMLLRRIKTIFDPHTIFNSGKIVDAFPMDKNLRYQPDSDEPNIDTLLDFSSSLGILREAEKCNGSGDCRASHEFGGTMCPSYRATKNEKDTTRARANALREFLTHSNKTNKFNHKALKGVFDLCLSCKGCAAECPSSVDVASLKAEFQYQYQKINGTSLRSKLFAYNTTLNSYASIFPWFTNFIFTNKITSSFLKLGLGIAKERQLPLVAQQTLASYYKSHIKTTALKKEVKTVYLFNDEFTNYIDTQIGIDALRLLSHLGYTVKIVQHNESGRTFISKGFLKQAKKIANKNVDCFKTIITENTPLVGIEPSAILTFRDEYLKLADDKKSAKQIAKHTFTFEEFFSNEIANGRITSNQFSLETRTIKYHGHCYQKALSHQIYSFNMLNLPKNYKVTLIPSGCCGMAGSFGYEREHYKISMQIGELTLFPKVRRAHATTIIAASGTSCRHQIKDGTTKEAKHPISILKEALL